MIITSIVLCYKYNVHIIVFWNIYLTPTTRQYTNSITTISSNWLRSCRTICLFSPRKPYISRVFRLWSLFKLDFYDCILCPYRPLGTIYSSLNPIIPFIPCGFQWFFDIFLTLDILLKLQLY